jgi:hypothetical protein
VVLDMSADTIALTEPSGPPFFGAILFVSVPMIAAGI